MVEGQGIAQRDFGTWKSTKIENQKAHNEMYQNQNMFYPKRWQILDVKETKQPPNPGACHFRHVTMG